MTFKKRYLIILIANTILSLLFLSAIPIGAHNFFSSTEYNNTGLVAQKRFHKELYARLLNKENLLNLIEKKRILMIIEQNKGITYSALNELNNLDIKNAITKFAINGKNNTGNFSYRTEPFRYKDTYGVFVFMIDKTTISGYIRLYLIPILILSSLFLFILPTLINFKLLYTLKMSFVKLEEAANKVSNGEFELNLVRDHKDELYNFYESFNSMGLMLKENRDQKARIIMSISHDLKTPLTSMKGYIEAFNDKVVPKGKEDKYFKIITDKSNTLEERINTLVEYSKMETTEWNKTFSKIDFKIFMEEIALAFKDDCLIYNKIFEYKIDLNKINILCDVKLLTRAIENILENAKRYTESRGKISLHVKEVSNKIEIKVTDNGIGIDESDIKYIFEPFYKVEKGRNSKGMGMGLYTVKSIIDNHGGSIKCSSTSTGTTFTIELPTLFERHIS